MMPNAKVLEEKKAVVASLVDLRAGLDHGALARFLLLFPENHEIFAPFSLFISQAARNAAFSPGTR